MAPKKGAKAGKEKSEDATKEEEARQDHERLQRQAAQCKRLCEDEERLYNQFLNEREKINYFWIVEKKTLAEKQAELRNRERETQDLEERQGIELKMFQQRLKHLRFHQQDEIVELKTDAELALKLEEDQHRLTEAEIKKDKRTLKVNMKEAEVAQEDFIRMLKLEQDQKMMELRQEFDAKARDLQQKYTQKMKTIRDQMETARKNEILRIDDEKNKHIRQCMDKNQKEFQDIKVYYGDITSSNLDMIKRLKEEHEEIKKRSASDSKHMLDLKQKNTQLSEPLRRANRDVDALQEELRLYEVDKKRLAEVKEKIKEQEKTAALNNFLTSFASQPAGSAASTEQQQHIFNAKVALMAVQSRVSELEHHHAAQAQAAANAAVAQQQHQAHLQAQAQAAASAALGMAHVQTPATATTAFSDAQHLARIQELLTRGISNASSTAASSVSAAPPPVAATIGTVASTTSGAPTSIPGISAAGVDLSHLRSLLEAQQRQSMGAAQTPATIPNAPGSPGRPPNEQVVGSSVASKPDEGSTCTTGGATSVSSETATNTTSATTVPSQAPIAAAPVVKTSPSTSNVRPATLSTTAGLSAPGIQLLIESLRAEQNGTSGVSSAPPLDEAVRNYIKQQQIAQQQHASNAVTAESN